MFKSNAVRSCVELHEIELNRFYEAWLEFRVSGTSPPYGEFNDETIDVVRALGLQFILWNVVSGDPDPTLSAAQIDDRLKRFVRKGGVIVMHANGRGIHTREVVEHLDQHLLPERRLTPMTITNLLNCSQTTP